MLYFSGKSKKLAVTGELGPGPVVPVLSQMNHQFIHSLVNHYPSPPVCIGSSTTPAKESGWGFSFLPLPGLYSGLALACTLG